MWARKSINRKLLKYVPVFVASVGNIVFKKALKGIGFEKEGDIEDRGVEKNRSLLSGR